MMQLNDPTIRNLLFDLGGVILNLAPQCTIEAFARLVNRDPDMVLKTYHERHEFSAYEKGDLTDEAFRTALRQMFATQATDDELDACWNAMLLDLPLERIQLLQKLRSRYQLILLSNTNAVHVRHFNQIVKSVTGQNTLDAYFDKIYYSHVLKMRKPEKEIYQHVLRSHQLVASETLFLDDNLSNLEGAQAVGIKTFHVQHPDLIFTLFNEPQA
jgi:glucose-1-phosphatase